ncbi:MAG: signal peptidase I [Hyphomicrobiales bacterium]|nr:signal peptidase I [Hyphomicrobiales bacterium]MDE2115623.1 signal peptidase I [Hyphomicrobiales bacterium]
MSEPVQTGNALETKPKVVQEDGLWETIKVILQALVIALGVQTILFQPFTIPSGSMIPTLDIGDYIFVSKYSYGYSEYSVPYLPQVYKFLAGWSNGLLTYSTPFDPHFFDGRFFSSPPKRGDVAVFKLPTDGETDYVKRVIGLPGDTIQMKMGRLYINGEAVPRTLIQSVHYTDRFGKTEDVPTYNETLPGGVTHVIIQRDGDHGMLANTDVYHVPPDNYFMMGDNRDNSEDSRVPPSEGGPGYVPLKNFIGHVVVTWFSIRPEYSFWQFWKWPVSIRFERLFRAVH